MSNGTPPASNPAGAGPGERSGEVGGKLPSLYDDIGGKEAVEALVEAFYDIVENEPEGRALLVHHLRGHGVAHSRIEQFNFLSGFLGGPRLYNEKYGHADVRKMHAHVDIDTAARDAWLQCMAMAIERRRFNDGLKARLMEPFTRVAHRLQNRA